MNTPTMVKVKYVGLKPSREDTVAGTGVTWFGQGDVQEVPLTAWTKLSKHPDVWARADAPADEAAGTSAKPEKRAFILKGDGKPDLDLGKLNDKALHKFVEQNQIPGINPEAKGDDLRAAIYDAIAAATAASTGA